MENEQAIGDFFLTLHSISPHLQELAQAMIKTANFWEGLSLSADHIGIPDELLEGLTERNPIQGTINTKSMTVNMTTSAGKGIITCIKSAKNHNIDI
jgi:peptide deformylase